MHSTKQNCDNDTDELKLHNPLIPCIYQQFISNAYHKSLYLRAIHSFTIMSSLQESTQSESEADILLIHDFVKEKSMSTIQTNV